VQPTRQTGFMGIEFAASPRSSVGIEWELQLIDRTSGELKNVADKVLASLYNDGEAEYPLTTGELLLNTIEVVSAAHPTVGAAVDDLIGQVERVREVTDPMFIELMSSGSHPMAQWFDQKISNKPRYHKLIERTQWWGRNMMIWGVHIHIGVEDSDKVFPLLGGLLNYYPHLQALSASSPIWAGQSTGYASNRALMFQQLPTAGLPYEIGSWSEYEEFVDDLTRTGIVDAPSEVRWDIRPSARWGTIEVRACDGISTAEEVATVAALTQCLIESMSRELDADRTLPHLKPWFVRENKWRSARYGLDASIIVDNAGTELPIRGHLAVLAEQLAPVAAELGCADELAGIHRILERGASYERQLAVLRASQGNLRDVTLALAREFRDGLA